MLTITYKNFKKSTKRDWPRYRSKRMDKVLEALLTYETKANEPNLKTLKTAFLLWMEKDPKEYKKRDEKSHDLCTALRKELGIYTFPAPQRDLLAYQITGKSRQSQNLRPNTTFIPTNTTTPDYLDDMKDKKIAVVVIDMQATSHEVSKIVTKSSEDLRSGGFSTNYNHQSVLENQIEVLEAAKGLDIPVFSVTTGNGKETISALASHFPKPSNVHHHKKVSNNAMDPSGITGKSLLEKFKETLGASGPRYLVVMGFDANQCVKGTIFGSLGVPSLKMSYKPGMLDLGFTVITSRKILASSNRPLESEFGPLDQM